MTWVIPSLVLFILAGYLTFLISTVNSKPPFMEHERTSDEPVQAFTVYAKHETVELARETFLLYRTGSIPERKGRSPRKFAFLGFQIPAHAEVKILVNNVMDANSCSSPRTADDFSSEDAGDQQVHHLTATAAGDGAYMLAPDTADQEYFVRCFVKSVVQPETYSTRRATFNFGNAWSSAPFGAPDPYGLHDYTVLRGLTLDLKGIQDSEDIRFGGGFQMQTSEGFETQRVLAPGEFVRASWKDIHSEQMRDILLVLIGTLVALGATMFTEALRPSVDMLIEKAPRGQ